MADIDLTVNQGAQPAEAGQVALKFEKIVDFSANNLGAADTAQLLDLPADILIIAAKVEVLTPEGGVATADLGVTGSDVDKYIDGADLNAAAGTVVVSGDAGVAEPVSMETSGLYLSAAETVSLLANNALATAVIRVQIVAFDMRNTLNNPAA